MGLFGGKNTAGTVVVDVEGDLSKFEQDVKRTATVAERELGGSFSRATRTAGAAMVGGAAAVTTAGITQFADFEKGMREVFTLLPDASEETFSAMSEQAKTFASEFGVLPNEVVPALYEALGAGIPQDNVFDFLETAQKLARGGVTELDTAVDGLSSVVNAYGADVVSAERASDIMFRTVGLGKGTVDEVASSLFNVTPIAAAMGVAFEDVGASLAILTAQGTPVSVATTQMRAVISELGKEGTKSSEAFESIAGKTFPEFIAEGGNLADALDVMTLAAAGNDASLIDMFGSIEAGQAALALTKDGTDGFRAAIDEMAGSAGSTDKAFETMSEGLSATLDRLKARFSVALINLGETLAPTIGAAGEALAGFAEILAALPGPLSAGIVGGIALAGSFLFLAGPILKAVQVVKMLSGAFTLLAANPVVLLIVAIGLAVAGLTYLIVTNWDTIKAKTAEVWAVFEAIIGGAVERVRGWIDGLLGAVMAVGDFFGGLPGRIGSAWETLKTLTGNAVDWIKRKLGELAAAVDRALGPLDEVIGKAGGFLGGAIGGIGNVLGFDTGGVVPGPTGAPRLILAHAGETVLPTHKAPASDFLGGRGGVSVTMHVSSEVRDPAFFERQATELARVVRRELDREERGKGR